MILRESIEYIITQDELEKFVPSEVCDMICKLPAGKEIATAQNKKFDAYHITVLDGGKFSIKKLADALAELSKETKTSDEVETEQPEASTETEVEIEEPETEADVSEPEASTEESEEEFGEEDLEDNVEVQLAPLESKFANLVRKPTTESNFVSESVEDYFKQKYKRI